MIVIVGESASGKSTVEKLLTTKYEYERVISVTTRPPRDGEVDGIDYYFTNDEEFESLKKAGYFIESAEYNGWKYGTPDNQYDNTSVVVATPHGMRQMKQNGIEVIAFYIMVDRRDRLIKILQRGDNIEEAYRRSLSDVGQYDGISCEVDYVIENDGYVKTPDEIAEFIDKVVNKKSVSSKPKLFLDYDCTIVNTIKCICDMYNEDFKYYPHFEKVNWTDIETWNFLELDLTTPQFIDCYFNQKRFFENIEFMDDAEEVIQELKEHFDITIVSHGDIPNLALKEQWIKEHMPFCSFIGVDMKYHHDKSSVDMSGGIFIDDRYNNLEGCNASVKICFGDVYEWNEDFDKDHSIYNYRAFNWNEVENILLDERDEFGYEIY